MKITLVVPSLRKTGVTEVIRNLLFQNKKNNFPIEYSLIVLEQTFSKNWPTFQKLVDRFYVLPKKNVINFKKIKEFKEIVDKINPDIIHFHGFNAELYIPFVKKYTLITTAHNMGKDDFDYSYGKIMSFFMTLTQQHNYKNLEEIIGVSSTVSQHYKSLGFTNVTTIKNGVEIPRNIVVSKNAKKLTRPIGVYVGNVDERKNTEQLLKVFNDFNKKLGTLFIVGDNPKNKKYFSELKRKYKNKNIIFLGRVKDVFPFLKSADYFISASKNEGLPMAAIEALGVNLDLILSGIPQHRELKISMNNRIYFFNNEKELKNILLKYKRNWNLNRNFVNLKSFNENFTASIMFQNYFRLYKKLIKN